MEISFWGLVSENTSGADRSHAFLPNVAFITINVTIWSLAAFSLTLFSMCSELDWGSFKDLKLFTHLRVQYNTEVKSC